MLLLNNWPIHRILFSGGEIQVKLPLEIHSERVVLTWKPTDASEITFLALVVNALNNMGVSDIDLDVLYFPYARQDRVCSPGEANSLEVICNMLDRLEFATIRIWDVHNPRKTFQLFSCTDIKHVTSTNIFQRYAVLDRFDTTNLLICAPDKGAYDSCSWLSRYFNLPPPIIMNKQRCPHTGKILSTKADESNPLLDGRDVLIVDDICDGGATFNQAAQILKEQGAKNLFLYVTHGIFSKGLDLLNENFNHIICHHVLHDDKYQPTKKLNILREHVYVS